MNMEESKSDKYVLPVIDSDPLIRKSDCSHSSKSKAPSSLLSKSSYSMSKSNESR